MWTLYMTLLISVYTSCVSMEKCPAEEDISPCYCSEIRGGDIIVGCQKSSFEEMLDLKTVKLSLNSLSGKNNVHLIIGNLRDGKLPSNFFSGIGIKSLRFDKCSLNCLKEGNQPWLLGLENYLEELRIEYDFGEVKETVDFSFSHLKKLKVLVFNYNVIITELGDGWFSNGPSHLETLRIDGNNIKKVGSNAFAQLNNLKELSLVGNRFGLIKRSMFPSSAGRLKILRLRDNALTDLPGDIFSEMPSLVTVELDFNKIATIDENTWSPIWRQLLSVSLDGNPIYCDDRLNWIFRSKDKPRVTGTCKRPKAFEGKDLEEFFENRSQ